MKTSVVVYVVLLCLFSPVVWAADDGNADRPVMCADLAGLSASIDELADAMSQSSDRAEHNQRLEIAIAYLQFRTRKIESLEGEVRRLEDRRASSEERITRMTNDIQSMERKMDQLEAERAAEIRYAIERYRRMIEGENERIDRADRQIIDLENRILDTRRQLIDLEDFVAENLDAAP